jgi:cytochrome c biogenesis protein
MFDSKRTGAVFIAVETFDAPKVPSEKRYYTGLQVTKDPGVGVVYAGFVLMIIGCIITFFMSHQRLCVEVVRSGGASRVIVAGNANKNKLGMRRKVEKIATQLGAPPPAGSPVDR